MRIGHAALGRATTAETAEMLHAGMLKAVLLSLATVSQTLSPASVYATSPFGNRHPGKLRAERETPNQKTVSGKIKVGSVHMLPRRASIRAKLWSSALVGFALMAAADARADQILHQEKFPFTTIGASQDEELRNQGWCGGNAGDAFCDNPPGTVATRGAKAQSASVQVRTVM
jgi:hypothetical protein